MKRGAGKRCKQGLVLLYLICLLAVGIGVALGFFVDYVTQNPNIFS